MVRDWEPAGALVSGPTGLEALELLVAEAPAWLDPAGTLVLELAPHQGEAVAAPGPRRRVRRGAAAPRPHRAHPHAHRTPPRRLIATFVGWLRRCAGDELDVDAMLARFRARADAVRERPLPPVAGPQREQFVQQAQLDFQDFAMLADATWEFVDGVLTLRVDLTG